MENQRDTVNILVPDVDPEILKKVVEYIYCGSVDLESKFMADFIEACNLLQLKATISCERKLVFDKCQKSTTFTAKATSTPMTQPSSNTAVTKQANLDSLIADLEQDENVEYRLKQDISEDSGQIVEVYEISNLEDAEITYEDDDHEMSEDNYELMNVVSDVKTEQQSVQRIHKIKKERTQPLFADIKTRMPAKTIDEQTMNMAITEIMSNSNR